MVSFADQPQFRVQHSLAPDGRGSDHGFLLAVLLVYSLLCAAQPYTGLVSTQVLVGLRNGTMLQLTASSEVMPTAAAQTSLLRRPVPQLQLTAIKKLGSLPVVLVPLPSAAGLVGTSLALSDRMALLSSAPGTGLAVASPLAVAGVTHAVPLWQPASSLSGNGISRQDSLLDSSFLAGAVQRSLSCLLEPAVSGAVQMPITPLTVPLTTCACRDVVCVPAIGIRCCRLHSSCRVLHALAKSQARQQLLRHLGQRLCGASPTGRLETKDLLHQCNRFKNKKLKLKKKSTNFN